MSLLTDTKLKYVGLSTMNSSAPSRQGKTRYVMVYSSSRLAVFFIDYYVFHPQMGLSDFCLPKGGKEGGGEIPNAEYPGLNFWILDIL